MSKDAIECLEQKVRDAIDYCLQEFDMTYAEAIGVLAIQVNALLNEIEDDEDAAY